MEDKLFSVKDKICIITGGLGQLGVQYTKALFGRGAYVAVFSRNVGEERIKKLFSPEECSSERIKFFQVDVLNKSQIEDALDEIQESWKRAPDVLINNAAIDMQPSSPPEVTGPFENFPEEIFREVIDVSLVGSFLCCQAVGARMVSAKKGGSIINIGSIYGVVSPVQEIYAYKEGLTGKPFIKPVAYSAAKSGLYNFTRYLATYWGKEGIRVNILTLAGVFRNTQDKQFQENYCRRIPIGRMAQENEYNGAVIFLASDASKYMTGSNIVVDGGWTAW